MIKINLLLLREARQKESLRQQMVFLLLFLVVTIIIMGAVQWYMVSRIQAATLSIAQAEGEISSLKAKIGQIENVRKLQEEVRKKLDVLKQLRAGKSGPAKRLAALSDAVPDKVWITKYSEAGDLLAVGGIAFTEELIADFMRNLEVSRQFYQVELLVSEQVDLSGIKAKRFDLTCRLGVRRNEESRPQ